MYNGKNPSALQSQQMLSEALVSLVDSYPFSEITVTMICTKAGVSRQTFYKMFDSKEDVARYVAKRKCLEFELSMIRYETLTMEELSAKTFSFFENNRKLIQNLVNNQLQHILLEQAQLALTDLLTCFDCDSANIMDESNRVFIAGGLCSMVMNWAEKDSKTSLESSVTHFTRLFTIRSFTRIGTAKEAAQKLQGI